MVCGARRCLRRCHVRRWRVAVSITQHRRKRTLRQVKIIPYHREKLLYTTYLFTHHGTRIFRCILAHIYRAFPSFFRYVLFTRCNDVFLFACFLVLSLCAENTRARQLLTCIYIQIWKREIKSEGSMRMSLGDDRMTMK